MTQDAEGFLSCDVGGCWTKGYTVCRHGTGSNTRDICRECWENDRDPGFRLDAEARNAGGSGE